MSAPLTPTAHMMEHARFSRLFPVPVLTYQVPDCDAMNARLRRLILDRAGSRPSVRKSNLGGWQSGDNIFDWGDRDVETVREYIARALDIATARLEIPGDYQFTFHTYGWANVNRSGDANLQHVHPTSTWSCAYYVDAGDDDRDRDNGNFVLHHPSLAAVMAFFPDMLPAIEVIRPESGMIVLFPSYVPHSVQPYRGERPRISIAVNAHGGLVRR